VKKIAKIDQYLAKIWTKCNSLVFLAHPVDPCTRARKQIRPSSVQEIVRKKDLVSR